MIITLCEVFFMKKIVFLDLDGTLWTNEIIPDSAIKAIHLAQENGHKIFVNSGRTWCEAIDTLEFLHLDGYCFSAGSEIYVDNKKLLYHPMPKQVVKDMYQFLTEYHVGISLEGSKKTFTNFINRKLFLHEFNTHPNSFAQIRFFNCPSIEDMTEIDYTQIMKFYIYNLNQTPYEVLQEGIPEECELTTFANWRGEITNKQYNKATAIAEISKYYDGAYTTVAVGDSENDIPMLKGADIAVVMGNGAEEVKKLGDFVTDHIDKDGLYKAFKHLELF